MSRREFTRNQREQIVERSKRKGSICCEKCGLVLGAKAFEIDHIIPEALRPESDKQVKITIAEGQLLGKCCHRGPNGKTNQDITRIAKAKRQYDRANGTKRPAGKIKSPGFPLTEKAAKPSKQPLSRRPLYQSNEVGQ